MSPSYLHIGVSAIFYALGRTYRERTDLEGLPLPIVLRLLDLERAELERANGRRAYR